MVSRVRCLVQCMMWWLLCCLCLSWVAFLAGLDVGKVGASLCFAAGNVYRITWAFCFWNALLILTNSARASIPGFVPKSVASWWSGAASSIMSQWFSWVGHSVRV